MAHSSPPHLMTTVYASGGSQIAEPSLHSNTLRKCTASPSPRMASTSSAEEMIRRYHSGQYQKGRTLQRNRRQRQFPVNFQSSSHLISCISLLQEIPGQGQHGPEQDQSLDSRGGMLYDVRATLWFISLFTLFIAASWSFTTATNPHHSQPHSRYEHASAQYTHNLGHAYRWRAGNTTSTAAP